MFSWAENPVWQLKGRYLKIVFAIGNLANFEICGKLNRFLKNVLNQMGDFFFFPLRKLKISCLGNWTLVTERNWLFKWNPKSQLPLLKKNKETNLTPYLCIYTYFALKTFFPLFPKGTLTNIQLSCWKEHTCLNPTQYFACFNIL